MLSDALPTNTTFVSMTQNSGPVFNPVIPPVGGTGTVKAVPRDPGERRLGGVHPGGPGRGEHAGQPADDQQHRNRREPEFLGDNNLANNTSTAMSTVQTQADLEVAFPTNSPNPVPGNSNLTYTITVTNHGPSDAQNVVLSERRRP